MQERKAPAQERKVPTQERKVPDQRRRPVQRSAPQVPEILKRCRRNPWWVRSSWPYRLTPAVRAILLAGRHEILMPGSARRRQARAAGPT